MNAIMERHERAPSLSERRRPMARNVPDLQGNIEMCKLVKGAEYVYTSSYPEACRGHTYRLVRFVVDLPSYQRKVLVEAVTGPDSDSWFTVAEGIFAMKFSLKPQQVVDASDQYQPDDGSGSETLVDAVVEPERVAGAYTMGSGV